jgi:2-polyprenyl-3-methyl-5-hydroxy-6-metoxy-1,4-benzoquinol methylase
MIIEEFISTFYPKKLLTLNIKEEDKYLADSYYENAKADAIFAFQSIKNYLSYNAKILEIGGGLHFLSNYLSYKGYQLTSLEPGGFSDYMDIMRKNLLNINFNKKNFIINTTLENYSDNYSKEKFDFIFSINVLEHTKNIRIHLEKTSNILSNKGIILIRCPNYSFCFDGHFYKFFIPFFPGFTFKTILKNKLINRLGEKNYYYLINNINFDCSYFNIKKNFSKLKFINPLKEIFERLETDAAFRKRIFANLFIKYFYLFVSYFKIKNILIKFFPIYLNPYLIIEIRK